MEIVKNRNITLDIESSKTNDLIKPFFKIEVIIGYESTGRKNNDYIEVALEEEVKQIVNLFEDIEQDYKKNNYDYNHCAIRDIKDALYEDYEDLPDWIDDFESFEIGGYCDHEGNIYLDRYSIVYVDEHQREFAVKIKIDE